tara:strand:+ start:2855 stop:3115 length:261 start_codon:yes stop_codon:yes gene_type:complete
MLERIDSRTLAEYMALEFIDPHGPLRGDIQAGIVASTIANVNRGKGVAAFTVQDFLPFKDSDRKQDSEEDMKTQLMTLAALTGGKK